MYVGMFVCIHTYVYAFCIRAGNGSIVVVIVQLFSYVELLGDVEHIVRYAYVI